MTKISYWIAARLGYIGITMMVVGLFMLLINAESRSVAARKQVIRANPACVLLDEGRDGYYYMACNGSIQLMRP